jgi:hypothetical protein
MNQTTATEVLNVQNSVDQIYEPLPQVLCAPFVRRMAQQIAYAIWEKDSVKVVPCVAKQYIYLLTTACRTWACQKVIIKPKARASHQVNPERRGFNRTAPLLCKITKFVEHGSPIQRRRSLCRGPDPPRL